MEKVLSQEEIDAMVRAARGRQSDGVQPARQHAIKPCNFRQSGQLTGEQVRALTILHEGFARSVSQSLGAYLRVVFEASLVSVEQVAYSEFLQRVPEVTYMTSFQVRPMGAAAAMQLDHSLVFPLVDLLLGGTGHCEPMTREVSEIEEQIMDGVARIVCRELAAAWAPMGTEIDLEHRQPTAQMQRFLAAGEKTLCLSFQVKLAEAQGAMNLVLPLSISNTLLRKLSTDWSYGKPKTISRSGRKLAERMLECPFPLILGIPDIKLRVKTVLEFTAGEVCNLGIPVRLPAALVIAGREVFEAEPVRQGRHRAAQVRQRIQTADTERKQ
jgi:flagellar motor switch protein FliM